MAQRPESDKKDGVLEVVAFMLMIFAMIFFLIWFAASNKIVFYFAPVVAWIGQLWAILPEGAPRAARIMEVAGEFRRDSGSVKFGDWFYFCNMSLKPLMFVLTGLLVGFLVATLMRVRPEVRRQFSKRTQEYLEGMSNVFTGIIPVMHLRMDLVKHKDPLWARQTFPVEVLTKEKVNGKPLIVEGKAIAERVDAYFMGVSPKPHEKTGLMVSRMLGNQVVDLTRDAGKTVHFADRFSPTGKVIFALLCAYASGDRSGYERARDQLNHSCRGAKSGMANLTVAQWLFDKHRDNAMARKLFAVHHWEYTYLYALFIEAKKMGKVTHAEFLWLKPMNRILFYVLNTVGRFTPHTESAAAFSQYAFERACSKAGRLPLHKAEDGRTLPSIFIKPATEGLLLEWERWVDGVDEDEEWWKSDAVWARVNGALRMAAPIPPAEAAIDTAFDKAMRGENDRAEKEFGDRVMTGVASVMGFSD